MAAPWFVACEVLVCLLCLLCLLTNGVILVAILRQRVLRTNIKMIQIVQLTLADLVFGIFLIKNDFLLMLGVVIYLLFKVNKLYARLAQRRPGVYGIHNRTHCNGA